MSTSGRHAAIAIHTATMTTTIRAAIDAMCTSTIFWRYDTSIDGSTRYQWPRIIAVQAPPSLAADGRKRAAVHARVARDERERESDPYAEMREEEEENGGQRHAKDRRVGQVWRAGRAWRAGRVERENGDS